MWTTCVISALAELLFDFAIKDEGIKVHGCLSLENVVSQAQSDITWTSIAVEETKMTSFSRKMH